MSIGARLREERTRLGFTQADFAALDGKSERSQVDWEAGVSVPKASYLAAVADKGVDVGYVLTGKRTVYPSAPAATVLTVREAHLLDNYRHASEAGRKALEVTGFALAQPSLLKRSA